MTLHFALLENGSPVAQSDSVRVVPWWSFGKTIIAAVALRLAEQGRLDLDRPHDGATLRQLLRHEAGLPDYGGLTNYHQAAGRGDPPWPWDDLIAQSGPRLFAPGEGWFYSNIGYRLVRERIEEAWGDNLGDAAIALLFDLLGITRVSLALLPEDLADVEMGTAANYHPGWVYHGLFVGPLVQAAALLADLLGDRSPLSATSQEVMRDARDLPHFRRLPWSMAAYGTGLMCPHSMDGWRAVGHTGGGPGSQIAVYRRTSGCDRTVAVFAHDGAEFDVETEVERRLRTGTA